MRCVRGTIACFLAPAMLGMGAARGEDMFAPERTGQLAWHVGAGEFTPTNNSQLGDQAGKFALSLGMSYRSTANLAWDIDLSWLHQNIDTPATILPPLWGTVDSRSSLDVSGIAGGARYIWPFGRWEPYVGGGLGGVDYVVSAQTTLGLEMRYVRVQTSLGSVLPGTLEAGGRTLSLVLRSTL